MKFRDLSRKRDYIAICRGKLSISRFFAEKRRFRDLSRKIANFAISTPPRQTNAPVTDCKDRQSLTRLRISAHHLEIEKGRHKNVARENRICTWCKLCMGQDVIENENHLLNECDLYEANRKVTLQKLSSSLLTSSHSTYTSTHPHFTTSSHSENIITLLPPHDHFKRTQKMHISIKH